jgi:hypothetical protein
MSEIPENERVVVDVSVEPKGRRRSRRQGGGVWGGVVLILLGIIFLFQQIGSFTFHNWWAVFILIPVLSSIGAAWRVYQSTGRFTHPGVLGPLYGAGYPLMVALIFLFDLNWGIWWPLFVLWAGLGAMASGLGLNLSSDARVRLAGRAVRPWIGWLGLGALLFGLTFLLRNLGMFYPTDYLANWWAVFIFFPAVGGLISTLRLAQAAGGFGPLAVLSLSATLVVAAVGLIALAGISWGLITPIVLIAAGVLALLSTVLRPERRDESRTMEF